LAKTVFPAHTVQAMEHAKETLPEKETESVSVTKDIQGKNVTHVPMASMKHSKTRASCSARSATYLVSMDARVPALRTVPSVVKDGS
jgi:hypothetical protein